MVYDEFETGNCKDIFQFGSDNMINLIRTIKPKSIVDLSSINAMFRPAIIQAGGIDEYIKNRQNPVEAKMILDNKSPLLWDILGESFGVPIFQEQIMFILQKIGGFTSDLVAAAAAAPPTACCRARPRWRRSSAAAATPKTAQSCRAPWSRGCCRHTRPSRASKTET